jgi:hypothetical protein
MAIHQAVNIKLISIFLFFIKINYWTSGEKKEPDVFFASIKGDESLRERKSLNYLLFYFAQMFYFR